MLIIILISTRYVAYYEWMKSHGRILPEAVPLRLTQIQITGITQLNIMNMMKCS